MQTQIRRKIVMTVYLKYFEFVKYGDAAKSTHGSFQVGCLSL